jgi:hypothetical protein
VRGAARKQARTRTHPSLQSQAGTTQRKPDAGPGNLGHPVTPKTSHNPLGKANRPEFTPLYADPDLAVSN